ncbi:unnamed protein product [Acanthoscelides obtectus]|uniref:Uncharacterized protein n=1 Tax=Acanthoscelides obtectus TaxID=200917 RepID=A0A9P0Q4P7_ACAOB|nr:unnamed protein product [Acanthoscelides obtectus]CAH2010547.1 unnamed protein product [Acanthoscelides obtectus]CAH2010549.1 unnamed protein product [Acanthoscelides obtectus]CAK1680429.1 hypothetical protein AOBTE_LOCUS32649 [Acanthoscelides obtectus]CAK1680431.1 hypothetical protein AOBTE_LOCUS32649 [Acanthoscelides obtectus]
MLFVCYINNHRIKFCLLIDFFYLFFDNRTKNGFLCLFQVMLKKQILNNIQIIHMMAVNMIEGDLKIVGFN